MGMPLRALIVEDTEDDAILLVRELKRGGYEVTYTRIETAEELRSALARQAWDMIFCDYNLPGFSGPAALELFKTNGSDIPFILVSGTVGEDVAVDMVKAGADDFVLKGQWKRLLPVVARELREAKARQDEVTGEPSAGLPRALEITPEARSTKGWDWWALWHRMIEPHPSVRGAEPRHQARLLSAVLLSFIFIDVLLVSLIPPAGADVPLGGATPLDFQHPVYRLQGAGLILLGLLYAASRSRYYRWIAFLTVILSVLLSYAATVVLPDTVIVRATFLIGILLSGVLLPVRATLVTILATLGLMLSLEWTAPGFGQQTAAGAMLLVLTTAAMTLVTAQIRNQDQKQIARQAHALAEHTATLNREIAKRERVETALAESNQTLRTIIQASPLAIITLDPDGLVRQWNPAAERLFGWSSAEVLGRPLPLIPEEDRESFRDRQRQLLQGETFTNYEERRQRKDGSRVQVSISSAPVRDQQGNVVGVLGILTDITARKQTETALHQRDAILDGVSFAAEQFMRNSQWEQSIPEVLARLGEATGTSRVYIFANHTGAAGELLTSQRYEWTAPGLEPQIANPQLQGFPLRAGGFGRWEEMLRQSKPIYGHVREFPASEHAVLAAQQIQSIAVVPILVGAAWWGFIGFDDCIAERVWSLPEVDALRTAAGVLGATIQRQQAETALRQANAELAASVHALEQRNREISLLGEMGDVLQVCHGAAEAHSAIARYAALLFPNLPGALYLFANSRDILEAATAWGDWTPEAHSFTPDDCWALRRGRTHWVKDVRTDLPCAHVTPAPDSPSPRAGEGHAVGTSLCVPMIAAGEMLGILHLRSGGGDTQEITQQLAETLAEHLALSLSNLKLRETLRQQSIRDPLTNLFNRRYLEETLTRETQRAQRADTPLGIIMFDIDHFKSFNDMYGHEAGNLVLQTIGQLLRTCVRGEDIACRYGGEEFTLILPGAALAAARERAEQLRAAVQALRVEYGMHSLGTLTLSIGVAVWPQHGATGNAVLQAADMALYRAKEAGRNRVAIADS